MDALAIFRDAERAIGHSVKLDGFCSINGGRDVACCAVQMSLAAITVQTEARVEFADAVILQFPQIGIVEAAVAAVFEGGFRLCFEPAPKSKLGTYLAWLDSGRLSANGDRDGREHERIVPLKRLTTLKRKGLPPCMARIVDLSRSGASFTCSKPLEAGDLVELGAFPSMVVRSIDGGAAVRFDDVIDERDFGVLIDLDAAPRPRI